MSIRPRINFTTSYIGKEYENTSTPKTNRAYTGQENRKEKINIFAFLDSHDIQDTHFINRKIVRKKRIASLFLDLSTQLYDPKTARFLSADTMIPNPSSTQDFNRYSYVLNNPLKYTDPSGHWAESSTKFRMKDDWELRKTYTYDLFKITYHYGSPFWIKTANMTSYHYRTPSGPYNSATIYKRNSYNEINVYHLEKSFIDKLEKDFKDAYGSGVDDDDYVTVARNGVSTSNELRKAAELGAKGISIGVGNNNSYNNAADNKSSNKFQSESQKALELYMHAHNPRSDIGKEIIKYKIGL